MRRYIASVLLVACVASSAAYARVQVRGVQDLSSDEKVSEIAQRFITLSQGNVIYAHCLQSYVFTEEQIRFQREAFRRTLEEYLQAFNNAYMNRVGFPPSNSVMNNYTKYAYAQESNAMNEMATVISTTNSRCLNGNVSRIIKAIEKLRYDHMAKEGTLSTTTSTTQPTGSH